MKTTRCSVLLYVLATLLAPAARAASMPGHFGTNSLLVAESAPRISLGANIEILQRNILLDGQNEGQIEANAYCASLGYDATPWLTVYGTAGAIFLESLHTPIAGEDYDAGLRWGIGFNASLFHIDTVNRDYAPGRFSIGLIGEYGNNAGSAAAGDVTWNELSVALPIGYEIPNEPMYFWGVTSMFIFAGPIFSQIDGSVETGTTYDFSEDQALGVLCGVDIYHSAKVSVGAHLQIMDEASANISARYHF